MKAWSALAAALLAILWLVSAEPSPDSQPNQLMEDALRAGKRRLAQSLLLSDLQNRESVHMKPAFTWKLGTLKGSAASTFRSFNQSFVLADKVLYRLTDSSSDSHFSVQPVAKFQAFLGEVAFVESVEWNGLLFLLAGYQEGLLQLFTVSNNNEVTLRQSIKCDGIPTTAEFFNQDDNLYLVLVANNGLSKTPITVYRWFGTQLDEQNKVYLAPATAVATFPFGGTVIVVIAVTDALSHKEGLVIFKHTGNQLQMVQFLPISRPLGLQHYSFRSENYVLVTSPSGKNVICWWSGSDLIVWSTLDSTSPVHSVGVAYVRGETILALAEELNIAFYRPTETALQLVNVHKISTPVHSASLHSHNDALFLLIISESQGNLIPYFLELDLIFQPAAVSHTYLPRDPLLQCLADVENHLKVRDSQLAEIGKLKTQLVRKSIRGRFKGKLVVKKLQLKNAGIQSQKANSNARATITAGLKQKIENLKEYADTLNSGLRNVVFKSVPSSLSGKLIAKHLTVNSASMDSVFIANLNGQRFDPNNILMYSKDQTITGSVFVDNLVSDKITVRSLNGIQVNDLLRRAGTQIVSGLEEVTNVTARKVTFVTSNAAVNNITLRRIVTVNKSAPPDAVVVVSGTKTFTGLNLQQLAVDLLNNVYFDNWINSLQPTSSLPPPNQPAGNVGNEAYTINGDLHLQDLNITGSINGVPLNDVLASLFLKGMTQTIKGDLTFEKTVSVKNLVASRINGIDSQSLMTKRTDQVLHGSLWLSSVSTPNLTCENINGLHLSRDVAYINSDLPVSTPVVFQKLQSNELYLPPAASIAGETIGMRLMTKPKIVYDGTITIKGALRLTDADFSSAKVQIQDTTVNLTNIELLYWTRRSDQVIPNSLFAPKGLHVKSLNVKTINNRPVESYVDLSRTELLRGTWQFPMATITGDIVHGPSALQYPISPKDLASVVVKSSGSYIISGLKIFAGEITVGSLITESLDSDEVSDILADTQGKAGKPKVNDLWIGGNIFIHSNLNELGTVNYVHLCEKLKKAVLIDGDGYIPAATISAVSSTNIIVNTINSVPLSIISRPQSSPMLSKIKIKGDVYVPSLDNVLSVNRKQVTTKFLSRVVDRTKSGEIHGRKTFASQVKVEGRFDSLDFNGVDLKYLFDNMLSKTREQTIISRMRMEDMSAAVLLSNVINGIEIQNLMTSDSLSRQTIQGDLVFTGNMDVMSSLTTETFMNNCNLALVHERLHVLDGRHWESLSVEGSLYWKDHLPLSVHGLWYYMDTAVTRHKNQIISAEVSFVKDVRVDNFITKSNAIDGIDLDYILVYDPVKKSRPDQVLNGHKIFTKQLSSSSMHVDGNVAAATIASVNIVQFNNTLVRVNGDQDVRGHKRFLQGFSADVLIVDGTVNGLVTSKVANYDLPKLPPIHFDGPLQIMGNLNFLRLNDDSFDDLLQNRVTLDSPQDVKSLITFARDLDILGNMVAPRINRLDIADIVLRDSLNEQVIGGRKNFLQSLRVEGPVEVDNFKSINLRMAHEAALFKDENATILGDLVFKNIVTMGPNLDVDTTVNDVEMAELSRLLRSTTARSFTQVHSIARTISDVNALLTARGDLSEMLYMEAVPEVPVSFTHTFHAVSTRISDYESYLDLYGWASHSVCGLPAQCACPAQYSVHVGSEDLKSVSWRTGLKPNTSERAFTIYFDNPQVKVVLKTNTVSSSSRCRLSGVKHLDEVTLLSWVEVPDSGVVPDREVTVRISQDSIYGYVSDVKGLSHQDRLYLFVALGYNADLDSTDVNSAVVRIDLKSQRATVVDEFLTHGVSSLDVFQTSRGYQVAVGNSYDTSRGSSQTSLDVYKFDVVSEKMVLKKSIPADGIISVASIVQGGDDLLIVAQKQLFTPVMVLKYDAKHDDYHAIQQLNPNTVPTGLGAFYIGQPRRSDAFLGVSTADDQFYLYKFCHIEGFKLVMTMELQGVQGFTTFSVGSRQYMIFTSNSSPSVFEIVKQIV